MSSVCVVTIYATSFVQVCAFVGSSLTNSRHVSHISHRPSHSMVSIFGKLSSKFWYLTFLLLANSLKSEGKFCTCEIVRTVVISGVVFPTFVFEV